MFKWITNASKNPEEDDFIGGDKKWRAQFKEGEPKSSEKYSKEELKNMGIIGLYKKEDEK
ncbi:MAG: hypothetical protein IM613_12460 [Cytophagales bacterium]|nr:hypothetical protein [Cytophagales bacterium]